MLLNFRLEGSRRSVFQRILRFFQLTAGLSTLLGQNPIFGLLQMNVGVVVFPTYTIKSERPLFSTMRDFADFETAYQHYDDILFSFKAKNFDKCKLLYYTGLSKWETIVDDNELVSILASLPPYRRKFSAGYYWTKVVEKGVEVLERLDEKSDAINGYLQLLQQTVFVPHHRGEWYNRLTILMSRIDKKPDAVVKMLAKGLKDPALRPYQRLELFERLKRCHKNAKENVRKKIKLEDFSMEFKRAPEIHITGKLCQTERMGKGKSVFIGEESGALVCSVEELALAHYRKEGFPEGTKWYFHRFSPL